MGYAASKKEKTCRIQFHATIADRVERAYHNLLHTKVIENRQKSKNISLFELLITICLHGHSSNTI